MANKGKCWNAKIETMPKNEMANLQLVKLKKQLQYNYKNSLFSAGWRVRSVRGFETKKWANRIFGLPILIRGVVLKDTPKISRC